MEPQVGAPKTQGRLPSKKDVWTKSWRMKTIQRRGSSVQPQQWIEKKNSTFREVLIAQGGYWSSKRGMVGRQGQGLVSWGQVLKDCDHHMRNLEFVLMVMGFKQEDDMIRAGF